MPLEVAWYRIKEESSAHPAGWKKERVKAGKFTDRADRLGIHSLRNNHSDSFIEVLHQCGSITCLLLTLSTRVKDLILFPITQAYIIS